MRQKEWKGGGGRTSERETSEGGRDDECERQQVREPTTSEGEITSKSEEG